MLSFSDDSSRVILVAPDNRLTCFSTLSSSSSSVPIRFAEKAHLSAGYCTSPVWLVNNNSSSSSSSSSSGSSSSSSRIANQKDLFAIGTSTGSVVVWDVKRAEIATRLTNSALQSVSSSSSKGSALTAARGSSIQSIVWTASTEKLYACQENSGSVLEWSFESYFSTIQSSSTISSTSIPVPRLISIDKRGLTRIAITSDGSTLFAAGGGGGDSIFMVDVVSGTKGRRLQGHSLPITGLTVSEDSQLVVSCSDERNLHLWDLKEKSVKAALILPSSSPMSVKSSSKTGSTAAANNSSNNNASSPVPPSVVLLHTGRPLPDSMSILRCKQGLYHIAALSEDGTALVWRYKRASKSGDEGAETEVSSSSAASAPILPSCVIRAEYAASTTALNAEAAFVAAISLKMSDDGTVTAHVAAGPISSPSFYEAKYTENNGKSLNLTSSVVVSVFQSQAHRKSAILATKKASKGGKEDEDEEMNGEGNDNDKDVIVDSIENSSSYTGSGAGVDIGPRTAVAGVSSTVMKVPRDVNNTNETIAESRIATAAARRSLRDGTEAAITASVGEKRRREPEGDTGAAASAAAYGGRENVEEDEGDDSGGASLGERLRAIVAALRDPNSVDIGSDLVAASTSTNNTSGSTSITKAAGSATTVAEAILSSTGSLATILTQALQAKDDAQLELVLSNSNEKGVVQATVARLPPQLVLPFVTRLVTRLQAKPARAQQLLAWVRAVLIQHTGFLLSQPALVANLEALYTVIDSRVAVYKKLLKLSGRLDLLMSQLPAEQGSGGQSRISAKALRRAKLTVEQTALEEKIVAKRKIEEQDDEDVEEEEEEEEEQGDNEEDENDDDEEDENDDDEEEEDD